MKLPLLPALFLLGCLFRKVLLEDLDCRTGLLDIVLDLNVYTIRNKVPHMRQELQPLQRPVAVRSFLCSTPAVGFVSCDFGI